MFAAAFTVGLFFCLPRSFHAASALGGGNHTQNCSDPALNPASATAPLAAPPNIAMETLNTNYILRWDWNQRWSQDVTFTTEYIPYFKHAKKTWKVLCSNQAHRSCDLSEAGLLYVGKYWVRVRAEANSSHSEWVELFFHPDEHARVGPPSRVALSRAGSGVDVHIQDPVTNGNESMRERIQNLYFYILYWEGPLSPQSSQVRNLSSKANLVTLPDLKAGTMYCVAVQTRENHYRKESSFTSPLCIQTPGVTVWWMSFLLFLGSMVTFLLMGLCVYKTSKWVKSLFYPASQLPSHFKEYLLDSPGSDKPRLLTSEAEQLYDKVVVCPRSFPEEQLPLPEAVAAPPSSLEAECSHQSGSRDSGVYSSDSSSSSSSGSQPSREQTSTGSDVFWTDLCDLDKPKMDVRAAGLLVEDEGVSDVLT